MLHDDHRLTPKNERDPLGFERQTPPWSVQTEGRFARGYRMAGKSWHVIDGNRRLVVLPFLSLVFTLLTAALILGPTAYASVRDGSRVPLIIGFVAFVFPSNLISTFFGVAFVGTVRAHLAGEPATVRGGIRFASSRLGAIAGWALLATIVGLAIQALERVRGGAIAARIAGWLLGVAWAIGVFFVIPVLASERVGPIAAARKSVSVVKQKWPEGIVGATVINVVFGLFMFPVVIIAVIAWGGFSSSPTFGVIAGCIAAALFLVISATQAAVDGVFRLALDDFAAAGTVHAPFTAEDLEAGVRPKRGLLRRFRGSRS